MRNYCLAFISAVVFFSCKKDTPVTPPPTETAMYFPPVTGSEWQTATPASQGWNSTALNDLYTLLEGKGTRSFIILKNGKIIAERYFGTTNAETIWYWASAGKTATAMLVGIAQGEGKLNLDHSTAQYLGSGWTSLPPAKEAAITIRHQLTMTSGLDDAGTPDTDCTTPSCLLYKGDAGTRWAYHNAPYTLLEKVVESATGTTYNNYFAQKIKDVTGMNGSWVKNGYNNVYYSNARSMARFGLLLLNKGRWDKTTVLGDTAFLTAQTNSSQSYNLSYGYLTWLNGKASYMMPGLQTALSGMLVPNAPADMYAALGKNDQKIYVVPSQNLVVIRMGDAAGDSKLAASSFDNELWGKLKEVIGY
jgi:CubicO group peptidase (beta-lactamase class C family)